MQIFVKTLTGTIVLDVAPSDSVRSVKRQLHEREGVAPGEQWLIGAGAGAGALRDERALADYNVQRGATLHLSLRLRGGDEGDDFGDPTPAEYVIVDSFLYAIYSIVYGMFCFTPVLFYFWGKYSALAMAASSDALKRVSDRVSDSKLEEGKKEKKEGG